MWYVIKRLDGVSKPISRNKIHLTMEEFYEMADRNCDEIYSFATEAAAEMFYAANHTVL